ncbi:MAG: alpha/beta hydrolase [Clostridia bacterium]|nr:alpha/beta hydrolase [Clostridia bacterium]
MPYRDTMITWMKEVRAMPYEEFCIRSFDGLRLYAKYYEREKGAPMEIMFHGYRGNAERDLCGGVQRAFSLGRSVLIVDQRAAGKSDGNVITFGIKESRDCLSWVDFAIEHFGKDVKIILTGISMGASTVMIAAGESLPKNVVGILADCGYSSPKEIIKKVIRDMKLPPNLSYPFVKLGALLFGRVDIEKYSCEQALKNCKLPIIFFHGDDDRYVPCEMSVQNHAACTSPKKLVLMKGAGHGMCYLMYPEQYLFEVSQFFTQNGVYTEIKK